MPALTSGHHLFYCLVLASTFAWTRSTLLSAACHKLCLDMDYSFVCYLPQPLVEQVFYSMLPALTSAGRQLFYCLLLASTFALTLTIVLSAACFDICLDAEGSIGRGGPFAGGWAVLNNKVPSCTTLHKRKKIKGRI